jgi:hypothetical protein
VAELLQSEITRTSERDHRSAEQIEFPLKVAVCAWCEPCSSGEVLGALSHGICLRHFRKLERQMKGIAPKRRTRLRRGSREGEPLLPF